ncbi:MAG TPA: NAD(P)H-dependent glycerol-3-phosphate dehydrogenase [Bryobacteraceae bacterium]|nr:NAD(P)H-dependent glycerol-3-phosphate dehydrogenase [Bryobacteraceae bacterium]
MSKLSIIGGGGWGTALACVLAQRFDHVSLWMHEADLADRTQRTRVNDVFLPGFELTGNIQSGSCLEGALAEADVVISAMPSHVVRSVYMQMAPLLKPGTPLVSATKGLEAGTLDRVSEVIRAVVGPAFPVAVLTGPTFAREVAAGLPTAVVAASSDQDLAQDLQQRFSGPTFRVYASADPIGAEIGGALKNVIAIGAGICDGLQLGHNALAALITRGLAELTRLAVASGGRQETMAGLAGLGDLVLTCTGDLSRNRQVGMKLAQGLQLREIVSSTRTVAEGVKTTAVAIELGARLGVELPIAQQMHTVLNEGRAPAEAIRVLMGRALKYEGD